LVFDFEMIFWFLAGFSWWCGIDTGHPVLTDGTAAIPSPCGLQQTDKTGAISEKPPRRLSLIFFLIELYTKKM